MTYRILFLMALVCNCLTGISQISQPQLQPLQYVDNNFGNALNFDGANTYGIGQVYPRDSIVSFTIEFWIKNTGTDGANDRIYGSYLNNALQIGKSTTGLKILATDLGYSAGWQAPCTLDSNRWVHIAVVRSLSTLTVYKNALSVGTYTVSSSLNLPTLFRLGSNIDGAGENGNFTIDEFRLWKNARSRSQIQQYMYTTVDPNVNANLILYYRFDQGQAGESNGPELGLYNSATSF